MSKQEWNIICELQEEFKRIEDQAVHANDGDTVNRYYHKRIAIEQLMWRLEHLTYI